MNPRASDEVRTEFVSIANLFRSYLYKLCIASCGSNPIRLFVILDQLPVVLFFRAFIGHV